MNNVKRNCVIIHSEVMLLKTIAKFCAIVISLSLFSGCHSVSSSDKQKNSNGESSADYEKPVVVGKLESKEISESSGLTASRCQSNVFWTHNDSGHKNEIFALDEKGKSLGKWTVSGAESKDWEDISLFKDKIGECFLYLGDIGNNARTRSELTIYRVKEPKIADGDSRTETAQAIKIVYPEMRHDAETLMVHPVSGDIYILTKRVSGASAVYKLKSDYDPNKTNTLEKLTDFTVPAIPNGFLTGGDISPDGKRVIICDYFNAYELVLPEKAKSFDEIWTQKPQVVQLGEREVGEAVTYSADGKSLFATSENRNAPFIQVKRK